MQITQFFSELFSPRKKEKQKTARSSTTKKIAIDAEKIARDAEIIRDKTAKRKSKKAASTASLSLGKKATKKESVPPTDSSIHLKIGKKKKKAAHITAAPIDEENLGFGVSLDEHGQQSCRRKAYRVSLQGLTVRCAPLGGLLDAVNLSASGIGFSYQARRLKLGVTIRIDILHNENVTVKDVQCKIMRHDAGVVGCQFLPMDRHQEDAVYGLVVTGQKEMAERRRIKKDQNWTPPS